MQPAGPTVYPSAIDAWLIVVLVAAPLSIVATGTVLLTRSTGAGLILILSGMLVGALIAALSVPCRYTLTSAQLRVRCGIIDDTVPLSKIRSVEASNSAWSAPALSLRRVKINLDDGFRLISPKERDLFIADLHARLAARAPAIPAVSTEHAP
jgi:hypothetical protein